MPAATSALIAEGPASDATSAAVATLPASLSALGQAVNSESVCTAAMLLPEMPSSPTAWLAESPQVQFPQDSPPLSVAEQLLQNDLVASAAVSGLLLAKKLLDPAAATPSLQTEQQGNSFSPEPKLPFRPASIAGSAVMSSPVPALPSPKDTVPPAIHSAATADQQAAAGEAAVPASVTHMAPPADYQPSSVPVQQQHGNAPVQYQPGGVHANQQLEETPAQWQHHNGGRGQDGTGDLLYEHLAAVFATVPALRDRVLTFAPLHPQMHSPGIDKPSRHAGQSPCLWLCG